MKGDAQRTPGRDGAPRRRDGASALCILLLFLSPVASLWAQAGYIYTQPDPAAPGGIEGNSPVSLAHVITIDQARSNVYSAPLAGDAKAFRFEHLPVGKYDLILVTRGHAVIEGLSLGEPPSALTPVSLQNLEKRIALADSFFNRRVMHRIGVEDGRALVFVERIRDSPTLKQSGEKLEANLRRLEVIELAQAADDWQMVSTRHIYREGEEIEANTPFFRHFHSAELGNIRVVDSVKHLGPIALPAGF